MKIHPGRYIVKAHDGRICPINVIVRKSTGKMVACVGRDGTAAAYITLSGSFYVFKGCEWAIAALKLLTEDPVKAAEEYAARTGRCSRCDRLLTAKESVVAGMGPICAKRSGYAR